jgi:hypothetical protein
LCLGARPRLRLYIEAVRFRVIMQFHWFITPYTCAPRHGPHWACGIR